MLLLLLANLGFGAWTQGWLDNLVGVRARGDREPERLARQVHPEAVSVAAPRAASSAGSAASATGAAGAAVMVAAASDASPAPPACMEAGPFDAVQVVAASAALQALQPPLPAGSWTDQKVEQPASWLVYMGRYPAGGALEKKEDELKRRDVDFEEVHLPGLDPGLALGRFDAKSAADEALAGFNRQGIRTARVVKSGDPSTAHLLRFERADAALSARLAAIQAGGALAAGFTPCSTATSR